MDTAQQHSDYHEAFYALRSQMAQYGSPSAAPMDWFAVEQAATELLSQMQDLQSACYLSFAQVAQRGAATLPETFNALTALCTDHWASMQPPPARQRARKNVLQWLHEQLGIVLAGASTQSASQYAEALQAAQKLDAVLLDHLNHDAPCFVRIIEGLAPPPPPRAPGVGAMAQPVPEPKRAVGPTNALDTPGYAPVLPSADNLVGMGQILLAHANAHLVLHPYDAGALRLRRQGLWLHIANAPDAVDEITRVAPLPTALVAELAALRAAEDWPALMACAEKAMARHRLIFCLQRHSAQALAAMGASHLRASLGIAAETYALMVRLPALRTACAADTSPLCDNATRAWLTALGLALPSAEPRAVQAANDDAHAHPGAQRAHVLGQLAEAEDLIAQGDHVVARAAFCALGRTLRKAQLAQWEPDVACRVWSGEAQALARMPKAPERTARLTQLVERVAGTNVHHAQSLHQSLKLLGVSS